MKITIAGLALTTLLLPTHLSRAQEVIGGGVNPTEQFPVGAQGLFLIDDVEEVFVSLFNGKTLDGWVQKNGQATYEVVDGTIMGRTAVGSPNSFLCSVKEYSDFDLKFEVKVDVGLNSGFQIRSLSKPGFKNGRVHGPQVEIESDPGEAGYIYSEGTGRDWISPTKTRRNVFNNDGWNEYRVLAEGNRIQTWVNGTHIEDVETAAAESLKGFLGLQVHEIGKDVGPFKVQWRNIRIKELDGTESRRIKALRGTPVVDGKIDEIWAVVPRLITDRLVEWESVVKEGQTPAWAAVRCLWDDGHLYCLAEVKDSKISVAAGEDWDCDSVEFFIDGDMARATSYDSDDAQYRTNAEGNVSAGESTNLDNYKSVVAKTKNGYIVEACINLETAAGTKIGFDVQVNDDPGEGRRMTIMKWNDSTNDTWQNLSKAGTLQLVGDKK